MVIVGISEICEVKWERPKSKEVSEPSIGVVWFLSHELLKPNIIVNVDVEP